MTDHELLKKLNNLRNIKPEQSWKKNYREVLYSQISSSRAAVQPKSSVQVIWETIMPRQILINLTRPIWLASAASVLLLAVGIGGVYASKNSKPGDSLYIAKIISERAQFAVTFNEKDKAKLGVEFAAQRAKEMIQVLNDSKKTAQANGDKLKVLSQSFKKEISQVKKSLTVIKEARNKGETKKAPAKNDDSEVFGANLGKSNERLEISEQSEAGEKETATSASDNLKIETSDNATSTPAGETEEIINKTDKILERAEKLFDEKNLDATIGALEEASRAIDNAGQVKGESETATSTER